MLLTLLACTNPVPQLDTLAAPDEVAGRALLDQVVAAHGGRDLLLNAGVIQVTVRDNWASKAFAPPYPQGPDSSFTFTYDYGLDKGHMAFTGHPVVWGHDSVEGWIEQDGKRSFDDVQHATFMVPTVAYFAALPSKLADPGAHPWPMPDLDGQRRLLVTFDAGVGVVQDRYVLYIEPSSHQLTRVDFTVADAGDSVAAVADYSWGADGLPSHIAIRATSPFEMDPLHDFTFTDWRRGVTFDASQFEKPDAR